MTTDDAKLQSVLVTGSDGYIGQHLVQFMESYGDTIVQLNHKDGDIADDTLIADVLGEFQPSIVYHLAGVTGVVDSWVEPNEFYRVNVLGVQRVLEYCRSTGAKLVFVSAYLYDGKTVRSVHEGDPISPMNPYAHSKYLGEELCRFYSKYYDVNCIIARPFNVYGGKQSNKFLVPTIVEQAISQDDVIIVQDDLPIRDYLYITDLVQVLRQLGNYNTEYDVFNIGSGVGYSVKEVVGLVQKIWNSNKEVISLGRSRTNEISVSIADIDKITQKLNWLPSYSLEAGLTEMFHTM